MRERSGRQDVPERSGPNGLARRASAANATTESGGEAEIAGGVGVRRGAATRSLRSARGAAHSVDAADWIGLVNGGDSRISDHLELSDSILRTDKPRILLRFVFVGETVVFRTGGERKAARRL